MHNFRKITDHFYAAPQIEPDEIDAAASEGFVAIIMNRPDGETPDQPATALIKDRADANQLPFVHIPITAPPQMSDVKATLEVLKAHEGQKVLAFCRSGTRSTTLWAYAVALDKAMPVDDILTAAMNGGYDLSPHRPALEALFAL